MSKLARTRQGITAETNWSEMVKVLFWADANNGRRSEIRKLFLENRSATTDTITSYNPDQFQYTLVLLLVISTAEKRVQELYQERFAEHCDAISREHQLKDDQFWTGEMPAEWTTLEQEFDQESLKIYLAVLREYSLDDVAMLVEADGLDQLFNIIESLKSQFLRALENSDATKQKAASESGSFPESLQPNSRQTKPGKDE